MPATRSNAYIAGIAFVVLFVGSISLVLIGVVHQIVSPISNSESTIFFNEYVFIMISFSTEKHFWKNKKFFVFCLVHVIWTEI